MKKAIKRTPHHPSILVLLGVLFVLITLVGTYGSTHKMDLSFMWKSEPAEEYPDKIFSYFYKREDGKIYFLDQQIKEADPATFSITKNLGQDFAKDKNHVFFQDKVIEGADPATFELVLPSFFFAKDAHHLYFIKHTLLGWSEGDEEKFANIQKTVERIEGDPNTFTITLSTTTPSTSPDTPQKVITIATDTTYTYFVAEERYTCTSNIAGCIGNISVYIRKNK